MPLPSQFTTSQEMDLLLSAQGVISFADHDRNNASDSGVVSSCIDYSTAFLFGQLAMRYQLAEIVTAPMIREMATVIACRTLCTRRGNDIPASLEMRYQEIVQQDGILDRIAKGLINLIDGNGNILLSRSFAPTFSNLRIDRRHPHEQVRVVQQSSMPVDSKLERDSHGGIIEGSSGSLASGY